MFSPSTGGRGLLTEFGSTAYSTGFAGAGGTGWDADQGKCYGGTVQLREIQGVCGLEGPSSPLEVGLVVVCRTPDTLVDSMTAVPVLYQVLSCVLHFTRNLQMPEEIEALVHCSGRVVARSRRVDERRGIATGFTVMRTVTTSEK